jgi:hypothetical protein
MILIYEDEQDTIEDEIEELKARGYGITCFARADRLFEFYKKNHGEIHAVIIDIMVFGPGNDFEIGDSDNGFESGVALLDSLEKIDEVNLSMKPSKIIYTNRTKPELIRKLKKDNRVKRVVVKNDQFYDQFVDQVVQIIKNHSS